VITEGPLRGRKRAEVCIMAAIPQLPSALGKTCPVPCLLRFQKRNEISVFDIRQTDAESSVIKVNQSIDPVG